MKPAFLHRSAYIFMLVLATVGLHAQIPTGYYNNASGKQGDELKSALHEIIKGHTTINYSNIWNAFWSTDNKGNGVVWDMYSDIPNGTPPYTFSMGQNQCGEYTQEGNCYNREHSWPQSWFSGDDQATPTRDLHHVFPTDGFVNSKRSNFPYGEVSTASWTSQNGSKLGTCKPSLGYSGTVFEPIDEYKGDFARALMYMSVRYYTEDDNWSTSDMTNKSVIEPWAIQMLLSWNDSDSVSQKEIDRNNVIYNDYQHNRNPFIDHPEYARMIWDPNWHGGGIGNGDYVKVTNPNDITDGDYLIVCENNNVAFNGALAALDGTGNKIDVTISNGVIASSEETDAAAFTITAKTGGYSIKSASGKYIGNTSNANDLKTSQTDDYVNSITILNDGNADIVCSSSHLRYNSATNQTRFRYYKSGTYTNQQAIQLYKKTAAYSITLASVQHGSITASAEEAVEGAVITLTATPESGYELDYWVVTDSNNEPVTVTENQFEMPASNVTVSAVFSYVGVFEQQYYLVTDADQLVAGRTYLIVNAAGNKALGEPSINNNNRTAVDVAVSNGILSDLNGACELTLGIDGNFWTFFDASWGNNGGYLYAASSSNNYLKTQATNDANGQWSIEFATNGVATIKAQGTNTHNWLRYNNGSTLFSCYTSGQQDVMLFIRSEQYEYNENTTLTCLNTFDKHIIGSGATLTASKVLGTNMLNDANYIIIEDGAQFVHHVDNVKATFKHNITGYVSQSGWYTIASPMTELVPAQVDDMLNDSYDLYAYDEAASREEWRNYKAEAFTMIPGAGYLYAHHPEVTLRMRGTLNNGDISPTVYLSYGNASEDLKGFNLLGNPTAHEISYTKSDNVSDGYYWIENGDAWTYEIGNTVPAGRGFFVKANAEGQSVVLNPNNRGANRENLAYLCLSIDGEKVFVKENGGVNMPLLAFNGKRARLYLEDNSQPCVMMARNEAAELPVHYKAETGIHRLQVSLNGMTTDYLHLIDNLTGADIDLLATSSYTFESKTNDFDSRFRLVFNPDASTGLVFDAPFAYISNGEIVVVGDAGAASLQVIDMMGRVIRSTDGVHTVSTNGMQAGVYVLRLIDSENVRTQKIVIN